MKIFFLVAGIILSLTAIFANQLGIDNDSGWGAGRILILEAGLLFSLFGLLLHFFGKPLHEFKERITELYLANIHRETSIRVVLIMAILLIGVTYGWYTRLNERDTSLSYNYYSELARSFKKGQLSLTEQPSSALLALSNPYDYDLRKTEGVEDFPWDVSLYEGKFYIYWGPTPALFLILFSDEILFKIEDHHIVLVFAFGLFIYAALIVSTIWHQLKHAPMWLFCVSLIVLGLSIPTMTMLSGGNVYEAAIFTSQSFFIGGMYWAISAFKEEKPSLWKLVAASVHWGLAVGSRMTILPVVAFAGAVTLFIAVKATTPPLSIKKSLSSIVAIGTPLLVVGVLLAWYNYARFDSIFEFGIKYQLANVNYNDFTESFSTRYFSDNVKQYFTHPISIKPRFPFISLVEYTGSNDRMAGLFFVSPFILLALILPILTIFTRKWNNERSQAGKGMPIGWMAFLFSGSALIAAGIIMVFYFITLRYTEDFMPSLLLFTILLAGQELHRMRKSLSKTVLSVVICTSAFITVTSAVLIAMPKGGVEFMLNLLNSISKLLGFR